MKLEVIPLAQIRENDYNPNRMPDEIFESLIASIRDHGYVQPVIIRRAEPCSKAEKAVLCPHISPHISYVVVDGAHRLRALHHLGRTEAACIVVKDDEHAAKLRTLTMNRLRGRMDNFDVAKILERFPRPEIKKYLAYTQKERRELRGLLARLPKPDLPKIPPVRTPVVEEFLLSREQSATLTKALRATGQEPRARALMTICEQYLERDGE